MLDFRTITDILSEWMASEFAGVFADAAYDFSNIRVVSTVNPEFGDFQCNDSMHLAKPLQMSPRDIAQAVANGADLHEAVDKVEVAGPGFINIFLNSDWLASYLMEMGARYDLGVSGRGRGQTVVLDYSGPNVAKPMHIGHIRSTIIGAALDKIFRALGYDVISDNHIGDWGTQFGIIIRGYREFADEAALEKDPIEELERIYVTSYERTKADEQWLAECREELVKLQNGDADNMAAWAEFVELSLMEFEKIYRRLNVKFDHVRGESFYRDMLADTVSLLERKKLACESEGATVVFLEDEKLPVCIVRKSDGGFNYATSDISAVLNRVEEFSPDRIVYVTDERQQLHFQQVFAVCRKLCCDAKLEHVWFGLMRLPEGTFSTREGNVIKLEALLDEAEKRAFEIVSESSPGMQDEQKRKVARAVGIGAVKYADLSQNPQTMVTFTWEKAMALDGNSGPYLQYAYARIASVRDKYSERFPGGDPDAHPVIFTDPLERTLALKLVQYSEAVVRAAESYKPSVIADYIYDLAQAYSSFYQNVPFLKAEEGVRESRVRLCGITARVLKAGLDLLGIETPDRI